MEVQRKFIYSSDKHCDGLAQRIIINNFQCAFNQLINAYKLR